MKLHSVTMISSQGQQCLRAEYRQSPQPYLLVAGHSDLALGATPIVVNGVAALSSLAALSIRSRALFKGLAIHSLAAARDLAGCATAAAVCGSDHAWRRSAGLVSNTNFALAA
jgi:hypothetical protein